MTLIRGGTLVQKYKIYSKNSFACTLLPLFILVYSSHSYADFLHEKKGRRRHGGRHKSHQQKIKQKERKNIYKKNFFSAEKQILNLIWPSSKKIKQRSTILRDYYCYVLCDIHNKPHLLKKHTCDDVGLPCGKRYNVMKFLWVLMVEALIWHETAVMVVFWDYYVWSLVWLKIFKVMKIFLSLSLW